MNKYFDKIYLINLERRSDRLEKMKIQLKSIGVTYAIVKAIDGDKEEIELIKGSHAWNKNSAALSLTTLKILEDAKKNNYNRIFIFEDDVEFIPQAKRYIDKIKWLQDDEWDMIHFGTIDKVRPDKSNTSWIKLKESYCCHAYGINSSVYDEYIEEIKKMDRPIDEITAKQLQTKGKCFKLSRTLCYQTRDYSNIRKRKVKYIIR